MEIKPSVPSFCILLTTWQVGFQNINGAVDRSNGRFITCVPQFTLPGDSFGVTELALLINYAGKTEKEEEKRPVGFAA